MKKFPPLTCLMFFLIFFQTFSAQESKPARIVRGGVISGKAVSLPKPPYPKEAKEAKASGAVNVKVIVGTDGKVETAEAVSEHELLRKPAEQAARAAKFAPTTVSGELVKVSGIITYNFVDASPIEKIGKTEKPKGKIKSDESKERSPQKRVRSRGNKK